MKTTSLKENMSALGDDRSSDWKAKAKYRLDNSEWLKKSAIIAVRVLDALESQCLSQKELAERMNISPQQVSKIVKGQENLTLETISKLEVALGIRLFEDTGSRKGSTGKKRKPAA
ncbi:MAG TPA: helix-turn-helix transcriptional regulator [Puia sp.]|nr:helix-turn-helix transcriptional regulator [Puia sp.]